MRLTGAVARFVRARPGLREPLREVLTRVGRHRSGPRNDIVLISARRSGSTWLMELLGTQPRMRYVDEPCEQFYYRRHGLRTGLEDVLPVMDSKLVAVAEADAEHYRNFFADPKATRIHGPYDPTRPTFHFSTDRRVLKIVNATALAQWLDDQRLGFDMVYLLRHPVPTVVSMAASVALRAQANLRHEGFVERHLTGEQERLGWDLLRSGSPLQRFALDWCLDSIVPFRAVSDQERDWTVLTYEELCLFPRQTVALLTERLGLDEPDRLLKQLQVPSQSTAQVRLDVFATEDAQQRVSRWRGKADPEDVRAIHEVVDSFGIDAYGPDSAIARPRWLHFAQTAGGS
ncbi:MAG: sulfotransferase domain-containing protein [Actinomycetota bacterium]|nr:sulfotransferase domain-containing protein [Actinomycetota bacterium]